MISFAFEKDYSGCCDLLHIKAKPELPILQGYFKSIGQSKK